jgi:hypothetical protein
MPITDNLIITENERQQYQSLELSKAQVEAEAKRLEERRARMIPRYVKLARLIDQNERCIANGNTEWKERTDISIERLMQTAPSGNGIDSGTTLIRENDGKAPKGVNKLQFRADFHHMNDAGYYDGWTEHIITVRPDLGFGFDLTVSGRNRNGIKEYLAEIYYQWLSEMVSEFEEE